MPTVKGLNALNGRNDQDEIVTGAGRLAAMDWVPTLDPQATFDGGSGDDTYNGTPDADTANGNAGNDTLNGAGGNDVLNGGTGNDNLNGGNDDDTLDIGTGDFVDRVEGGLGSDRMIVDWADATTGIVDRGYAGYERALSDGPTARLVLFNEVDHLTITTGSGDDSFTATAGNDVVDLRGGNDFVNLLGGNDTADGGTGIDGFSADLSARTAGVTINLLTNTSTGNAFRNFEYFGTVIGTGMNDTFVTTSEQRNETLNTGNGDDTVTVYNGFDIFRAGLGNDTLIVDYSAETNAIGNQGYAGFDNAIVRLSDPGQRGVVYSEVDRFIVTTGSGNDVLTLGTGDDVANMGGGDDFVNLLTGNDIADGGSGIDGFSANLSGRAAGVTINLLTNTSTGNAFQNFEYFGTVTGTMFDDIFVTTSELRGEEINTGNGNDTVTVYNGFDIFRAGLGDDLLIIDYSAETRRIVNQGYAGFDGAIVRADDPGQRGVRYSEVDRFNVTTGSGDDEITVGTGNDIVSLGDGNDFVNMLTGIGDRADGGAGEDGFSANLTGRSGGMTINLQTGTSTDNAFTNFEYVGTLIGTSENDVIVTSSVLRNETIETGNGDDTVTVVNGVDNVRGGFGNDTLIVDWAAATRDINDTGQAGFDRSFTDSNNLLVRSAEFERFNVTTGSGNDTITTGNGNDIVSLGSGNDFVNLQAGSDAADGGEGVDGFSADQSGRGTALNINLQTGASNFVTNFEYIGTLTATSLNDTIVTSSLLRNEIIQLGNGDDTVTVVNGHDNVYGSFGNDTLIVDWSAADRDINDTGQAGFDRSFTDSQNLLVRSLEFERYFVTTGSGNDRITTGNGDDIVNLGTGNDFVNIGIGSSTGDVADGGAGIDGLSADVTARGAITINLQTNVSTGNSFSNFEYFGTLTTGSGDDTIVTTDVLANEIIITNNGNDTITVVNGDDQVRGGNGIDTLIVQYGASTGDVNNQGFAGFDGGFNDGISRVVRYAEIERFDITTGSGNDNITTGNGDDRIILGTGNNTANSGAGDDVVQVNGGTTAANTGTSNLALGSGADDRVVIDYRTITAQSVTNTATSVSIGGLVRANFSGAENLSIFAGGGNDTLTGGTGNDVLGGGTGADNLTGNDGNDTLYFGGDFEILDTAAGGNGRDILALQGVYAATTLSSVNVTGVEVLALMSGRDNFLGGATGTANSYNITMDDSIVGVGQSFLVAANGLRADEALVFNGAGETNGSFVVLSGAGNDTITGGAGNDQLNGGLGSDALSGGLGDDVYFLTTGDTIVEVAGQGFDAAYLDGTSYTLGAGVSVELLGVVNSSGTVGVTLTGNDLAQTIVGTEGADTLNGGGGNDFLRGGGGNDVLDGGTGSDVLQGGAGNDTYTVESWMDVVQESAGGGIDTINTTGSFVLWDANEIEILRATNAPAGVALYGNSFAQEITGGAFNDQLSGGGGADTLNGGAGNDVIDGGAGADTLTGGTGNDIYYVSEAGDTVAEAAGEGFDAVYAASSFSLGADSEVELIAAQLPAGTTAIDLAGSSASQTIRGNAGANTLMGMGGNDFLFGGDGNDILDGGTGTDIMEGGAGSDTFRFTSIADAPLAAPDQIRDFLSGTDRIDLSGIDANANIDGNQDFTFLGTGAFSGTAGELRYEVVNGQILINGDVNGDGVADFAIFLNNTTTLSASDIDGLIIP